MKEHRIICTHDNTLRYHTSYTAATSAKDKKTRTNTNLRLDAIPLEQEVCADLTEGVLVLAEGFQHAGLSETGELVPDLPSETNRAVCQRQGVLSVLLVRGAPFFFFVRNSAEKKNNSFLQARLTSPLVLGFRHGIFFLKRVERMWAKQTFSV